MLALFDIDGTLLLSRGASLRCVTAAASEVLGRALEHDGLLTAGGLDPDIFRRLCAVNGVAAAVADEHHDRYRAAYGRLLAAELAPGGVAYPLPGVPELLDALATRSDPTLGLLSGNYPETGLMKVAAAGLDPDRFRLGAWGVDGSERRALVPVAIERHAECTGEVLSPEQVVVVGDTPHDVDCATAHGCRSLAVATGPYDVEQLSSHGADLVLPDLSDTAAVLDWFLSIVDERPDARARD